MTVKLTVVYWDASAVLSVCFYREQSEVAMDRAREPGIHLISSLAWAESHAVIARLERENAIASIFAEAARESLDRGPWRRVHLTPDWRDAADLARRWPLRGADLWHLALASRLRIDLPELELLTFYTRLATAARAEGL